MEGWDTNFLAGLWQRSFPNLIYSEHIPNEPQGSIIKFPIVLAEDTVISVFHKIDSAGRTIKKRKAELVVISKRALEVMCDEKCLAKIQMII